MMRTQLHICKRLSWGHDVSGGGRERVELGVDLRVGSNGGEGRVEGREERVVDD
jgi:hypothetical protein